MNTFELRVFDDEASQCSFYTVLQDGHTQSEADKFFGKYQNDIRLKEALQELVNFLFIQIGDKYGALPQFFRFENAAHALPPPGRYKVGEITIDYANFPLRLYCLRLSNHLVVLFNGAEKTSQTAQGGKTSMAFTEANQFATRILEAIYSKEIFTSQNGRTFECKDGSDEIIL